MWTPDEPPIGGGGGAPSPTPAPAPAAAAPSPAAPASAPAVTATPAPALSAESPAPATPSPTPAMESGPAVEGAVPASPDAVVQPARSFLTEHLDKSKPAETPKTTVGAEATPKPGEKPGEAPEIKAPTVGAEARPPISWAYEIPEEINLNPEGTLKAKVNFDDEAKTKVNAMLEAFSTNPGSKDTQQALVDFHLDRLREQNNQQDAFNRNFWNDTRKGWRERWAGDTEIGGSGFETSKAVASRALDVAMRWKDTSPANLAFHRDVEEFFETTGAGDHPAMGRILTRIGRFLDESPPPPPNVKPPPDNSKQPGRGGLRGQYKSMPS